jgi:hypothetical protein
MAQVTPVKIYSCTEIQYELEGTYRYTNRSAYTVFQYSFCETGARLCTSLSAYLPTAYLLLLHLHNAIIVNIVI